MTKITFVNNFFLKHENNKFEITYTNFFNKKKKKLNFHSRNKKINHSFELGYKLENLSSGEYSLINVKNNCVNVSIDLFNSYPIYYLIKKNYFALSSNINDLNKLEKNYLLNKESLKQQYIFGFCISDNQTIYKNIKTLYPNSFNIFKNNNLKSKKINKKKFNLPKKNLFKDLITKKKNYLGLKKNFLPITNGIDSNILLRKLIENKIDFSCGTIGNEKSFDVIGGKKNSKNLNKNHLFFNQNYNKKKNILILLKEYSIITGGIGISSEILLLEMVKKISKNFNFIFLGGGGEFYRNYFKNKNFFLKNYLTTKSTLKKFLKNKFYLTCKEYVDKFENKKISLDKFYLKKRYPRNTNRKILYIKNYMFPINFFVDEMLLSKFKSKKYKNINNFFGIKLNKLNLNSNNIEAFNIENFFKLIKPILINEIKKKNYVDNLGIDKKRTLRFLRANLLNEKDKWFLLRILNLILYINLNK